MICLRFPRNKHIILVMVTLLLCSSCSNLNATSSPNSTFQTIDSFDENICRQDKAIGNSLQDREEDIDGSVLQLMQSEQKTTYKLTIDIFEDIYSNQKIETAEVKISVPSNWKPRVDEWRSWIKNKKEYDLAGPFKSLSSFGFKNSNESSETDHIMCSNLYGWKNSDFEDYIHDLHERYDYIPKNVEVLEIFQIGNIPWLKHIERYPVSQEEIEECSNDTQHMATYLCEYKGGLVSITFFYQGHENEPKLQEQEEVLLSWCFVDECCE